MSQPFKTCPNCGQNAALPLTACLRCGHVYRTPFAPPDQCSPARKGKLSGVTILLSICAIASIVFIFAFLEQKQQERAREAKMQAYMDCMRRLQIRQQTEGADPTRNEMDIFGCFDPSRNAP